MKLLLLSSEGSKANVLFKVTFPLGLDVLV